MSVEAIMKQWMAMGILSFVIMAVAPAHAMVGQWVDGKVMGFENANVRVQSQYWEFVVDSKKVAPDTVKAFRMASKDKPVTFLLPQDAVISKKRLKHKKHSSKKAGKK